MPSVLEAVLFMDSESSSVGTPLTAYSLFDHARDLAAPAKTFAQFADLVISATIAQDAEPGHVKSLPVSIASRLLGKIINAIRDQVDYDVLRAARWIRCVIQMILDSRSRPEATDLISEMVEKQEGESLDIVESVINEALALAQSAADQTTSLDSRGTSQPPRGQQDFKQCYPSDELHWLSAALFNLAVDFYIDEKPVKAEKWTRIAVELADALGRNTKEDGGDDGKLSRDLRTRAGRMEFHI
jgi:hypothetical protein